MSTPRYGSGGAAATDGFPPPGSTAEADGVTGRDRTSELPGARQAAQDPAARAVPAEQAAAVEGAETDREPAATEDADQDAGGDADQGAGGDPDDLTATPRRRGRTALLVGLAFVVLALGALVVVAGLILRGHTSHQDARQQALQAGQQDALNLLSLNSSDVQGSITRIQQSVTGALLDDYKKNEATLRKTLQTSKVASSYKIIDAAVVHADDSSAQVMVVADGSVSNTSSPAAQARKYRLVLTLTRVDGRWLTSDVAGQSS